MIYNTFIKYKINTLKNECGKIHQKFFFLILKIANFKFGNFNKIKKLKTLFDAFFYAESENVIF